MNIQIAAYKYISHILNTTPGPKVVLFDNETLPIISMSITKTELLSLEVVLTGNFEEILQGPYTTDLSSLQVVCFIRPTDENIMLLGSELGHPHFMHYILAFTNVVSDAFLRQIAARDSNCLVNSILEAFLDVYPIGSRIFSINIPVVKELRFSYLPTNPKVQRIVEGLFSNLCSLKVRPQIRYDKSSPMCVQIAQSISKQVDQYVDIFSAQPSPHLLLILDRVSDPVTPLLHHWYYTESLHDLFGIKDNTVQVNGKQLVLDERTDFIFSEYCNQYLGDVFTDIQNKLNKIRSVADSVKQTPADISDFHEKISAVARGQEEKTRVAEHVSLLEAVTSIVDGNKLTLTQLEQMVATDQDINQMLDLTLQTIANETTSDEDALRLSMIFMLHYDGEKADQLDQALANKGIPESQRALLNKILEYGGKDKRGPEDIFFNKSLVAGIFKIVKSLKGTSADLYDRYSCLVKQLIERIRDGTLKEENYPFVQKNNMCSVKPQKVIIFIAGGVTYEEARIAALLSQKDFEVIVGGTSVLNAKEFIANEVN